MPTKKTMVMETQFTARDRLSGVVKRMSRATSRFGRVAHRVKIRLQRLGRAALQAGKFLAGMMARGLGIAAAGAVGLFAGVSRLAQGMDTLAKKARSIDFPIEQFQEWRFVAEQSGVQSETFDKSMQKFTRAVGEAKMGTGALTTILKRNDKQLLTQLKNTDNVADAFDIYMRAISSIDDPTRKAALSAAAFGRSGIDMINVANLSKEEMAKLRAEMRENGVVTEEQARKAEEFNDMMNRVKLTLVSVATDALTPLMPLFTKGADKLRKWVNKNRELIKQRVAEWVEKIVKWLKSAKKWWDENKEAIGNFFKKVLGFVKFIIKNKEAIGNFFKIILDFVKYIIENKESISNFFNKVLGFVKFMIENKEAVLGFGAAVAAIGIAAGGIPSMITIGFSMVAVGAIAKWYESTVINPARQDRTKASDSLQNQIDVYRGKNGTRGVLNADDRKKRIDGLERILEEERGVKNLGSKLYNAKTSEAFGILGRHVRSKFQNSASLLTGTSGKRQADMMAAQQGIDMLNRDTAIDAGQFLRGGIDKVSKLMQPRKNTTETKIIKEQVDVNINTTTGKTTVTKSKTNGMTLNAVGAR